MDVTDKLYKAVINAISMFYFDPLTPKGLKTNMFKTNVGHLSN